MMKEKMLASWLADNQQVRLHLNKLWPEKSATGASVTYAGEEWYLSWQGVIQSSASYGRWILKCGAINKIPRRYFLYAATWCTNEPLPRTRFYAAGNATRISHFCGVESQRFPDITGVMRNDEMAQRQVQRLTELQRAFVYLEGDFGQIIPRPPRGDERLFYAARYQRQSADWSISFMRNGWQNPMGILPRSELQRVGYRLRHQQLERLSYVHTDPQAGEEPIRRFC